MARLAVARAEELGLRDRVVFFNEGWVPYEQRGAYLLEADLGVSAHFDDLESRFAFRTRLLDCFWAGLPVVTTVGRLARRPRRAARSRARRRRRGTSPRGSRALESLLDDARGVRARAPPRSPPCATSSSGRASSSRCGGSCGEPGMPVPRRRTRGRRGELDRAGACGTPSPTAASRGAARRLGAARTRRLSRRSVR